MADLFSILHFMVHLKLFLLLEERISNAAKPEELNNTGIQTVPTLTMLGQYSQYRRALLKSKIAYRGN
ncbi:hypothetical protein [Paraglaciecola hydrolytica]|uniref:Uncharacterized protein n=1 Tax=Paraglaciecola hydrolytica TaxID=1799789 RepID=A0A135ZZW4_9ALTE|nr:hypothetical protein [Paraglaciecola hydrolytica]KXI28483.1 hypothetical protein AX660_15435 [Paraglaciecola hydrolytica]